jgi:hypothetical protein
VPGCQSWTVASPEDAKSSSSCQRKTNCPKKKIFTIHPRELKAVACLLLLKAAEVAGRIGPNQAATGSSSAIAWTAAKSCRTCTVTSSADALWLGRRVELFPAPLEFLRA